MSDQTQGGIAWTDETWNPVRGCSRVSKGCEHCYAETVARRFSGPGQPYQGLVRLDADGRAKAQWNGTVRFVEEHLGDPLRWTRPRKVFVNSMSDLFHESLAFEAIAAIFGVMAAAPRHTFQVLTKRPKRARAFFAWVASSPLGVAACADAASRRVPERMFPIAPPWPLPNVWLGVSVEDQASADERITELLACPAAVRWVSYEPALGPVDFGLLGTLPASMTGGAYVLAAERLHWIVVGGESGPGARPFDLAWARSVIAQCREAGAAAFIKQLGAAPWQHIAPSGAPDDGGDFVPVTLRDRKGGDVSEWPEDVRVREWPRGAR